MFFLKARWLDVAKLAISKEEFAMMERLDIVRRFNSPWAFLLHMVPKKGGGWHPVGISGALMMFTHRLATLSRSFMIFLSTWWGQQFFQRWIWHITPFGLFGFLWMPFDLKGAIQTFQRLMESVLWDLPFVFIYLDNILVAICGWASVTSASAVFAVAWTRTDCEPSVSSVCQLSNISGHHVSPKEVVPIPTFLMYQFFGNGALFIFYLRFSCIQHS